MSILLIRLGNTFLDTEKLDRIRAALPAGMTILHTKDDAEIRAHLPEIELCAGYFPLDMLAEAAGLRWWQSWSAGTDWLMRYPQARTQPFVLTNARGIHAIPMAEHVFGMLLTFARQLHHARAAQLAGTWPSVSFDPSTATRNDALFIDDLFELAGKTMVVIGVGAIGGRTAEIAQAFGMRVIGVRRDPSRTMPGIAQMVSPDQLLAVLPEADVVVSAAPYTAETHHQLDAAAFRAMKNRAIVINMGRGGTIDEEAMIAALQNGEIAGAGLDVFETEPLAADSPLWQMPNVLITAHYAGDTPHYDERMLEIFLDNLARYQAGRPLVNLVDKQKGY